MLSPLTSKHGVSSSPSFSGEFPMRRISLLKIILCICIVVSSRIQAIEYSRLSHKTFHRARGCLEDIPCLVFQTLPFFKNRLHLFRKPFSRTLFFVVVEHELLVKLVFLRGSLELRSRCSNAQQRSLAATLSSNVAQGAMEMTTRRGGFFVRTMTTNRNTEGFIQPRYPY